MPPAMPFQLNTGRLRDQWHTMTRTGRAPRLLAHTEAPFVALNPRDAQSLGIREGDLVDVFNRDAQGERQSLLLLASLDKGQRDGEVFVPIHWNGQFASHGLVNRLIASVADPVSGQPESKFAWVGVRAVTVQHWAVVISREPVNTEPFDFWVRTPVKDGWRTLVARTRLPTADTELAWQQWLAMLAEGREKIEGSNTVSGEYRALLCHGSRIEAAVFAGTAREGLPETPWLQTLLQHTVNTESWQLLHRQETSALNAGRIICSCFRVSEERILEAIAKGARSTEDLGKTLRCGTNCGSCIPELKQLLPL
jgi:assimilatory nitrate reductase catalytic subunit